MQSCRFHVHSAMTVINAESIDRSQGGRSDLFLMLWIPDGSLLIFGTLTS